MNNTLNIKSFKKSRLVELLLNTEDKRRYHSLYLSSCYFNLESAMELINEIGRSIHIYEVVIHVDRKEAISIGKVELEKFCNSFKSFKVNFYAVDANSLFHSKLYALISYDNNGDVFCGSLVIGSANLTGRGLVNRSGNIESMLDTQDHELLLQFVKQTKKLACFSIQDIENFSSADEYSFKYSLLQEGAFIHKWMDNLGQYLSVRYQLNGNGKKIIGDDKFRIAGFNIEAATISKRYFDFSYEPPHLDGAENLTRNYGIETYLGYWLPLEALETMFDQNKFSEFRNALESELKNQICAIRGAILKDFEYLKSEGVINISDANPVDVFQNKVDDLLVNELRLKRIFSKYKILFLPYGVNQKQEVEELFDDMVLFSESRARKNITMKAFLSSIDKVSLDLFRNAISMSVENNN